MNDRDEIWQEWKRMTDLWDPWYEVTHENSLWHATCRETGAQFHAARVQELHKAIWEHYMPGPPAELFPVGN